MNDDIPNLLSEATKAADAAASSAALDAVRVEWLGKSGRVTELLKGLGKLPADQRKARGAALNELKAAVEGRIQERVEKIRGTELDARLTAERVDVTLPARPMPDGRIHPISQTIDEIVAIFGDMGFSVAEGPDIEDDFHNFTALNIPPEHPARQEHDTFYLPERADGTRLVLRTHTSPVQIRTMLKEKPPLRIIVPGRTFRCDHDATHSPMFHQVEGLVVDE